ncbi:MAG: lipocalin family protein [Steroidobacteraceae bacterium]
MKRKLTKLTVKWLEHPSLERHDPRHRRSPAAEVRSHETHEPGRHTARRFDSAGAGRLQEPGANAHGGKRGPARFMGSWYVLASIPTFIERDAHNAVESYALDADGSIDTHFTFRAGSFDGKPKAYNPRGFVIDRQSNALWGMRFIWPVKADYRIIYLSDDYTQTVIGRQKRDYVWIMARTPAIAAADYERLLRFVADQGYDVTRVKQVPQRWPAKAAADSSAR